MEIQTLTCNWCLALKFDRRFCWSVKGMQDGYRWNLVEKVTA